MLKFLLFSDFHYGKKKYPITLNDLDKILKRGADENVEFVIQCGDFCVDAVNSPELFKAFLDNKYGLPVYGIYGNHELETPGNSMDFITPKLSNRELNKPFPDASYWYKDIKNFRFVGLDSNYSFDPNKGEWEHTLPGHTMGKPGNIHLAFVSPDEIKWLKNTLDDAKEKNLKVIILSHHPLSGCFNFGGDDDDCVNATEIKALLKNYIHTVVMCISGDLHAEFYAGIEKIIYYGITSSKYLDTNLKGNKVYPDDLTFDYMDFDKDGNYIGTYKKPYNEVSFNTAYYTEEPLCAIVTIDDDGIVRIKGKYSDWVGGIAPEDNDFKFPHDNYITNKAFKLEI